ncbi:uncharacterized protein LOC135395186 [Ornithodoros turicata]|uniref:uncharacterized protein LOC135395186 n=1 Tax=Ornithodoros turicata TaxID=34597 RepID=UPI003138A446
MATSTRWIAVILQLSSSFLGTIGATEELCLARHLDHDLEVVGRCVPLLECLDSFRSLGHLKVPNFCRIEGLNPIVCCPNKMDQRPPVSTPTTTTVTSTVPPQTCKDKDGAIGNCIPVDQCTSLQKAAENKQFPPLCDFKMSIPYVCCVADAPPSQAVGVVTYTNPKPPPVTTEELLNDNQRYCGRKHYLPPGQTDLKFVVKGGKNAPKGKYKFAVAIFRDKVGVLNFWCGGTLITRRVVLSAAHCFHDTLNDTKYVARIGGVDIKHNSEDIFIERGIAAVHVHPDYDPNFNYADVAVLLLDSVSGIAPREVPAACLPDRDRDPQVPRALVLGWGHDNFGGRVQTHLQEAYVPVVGREQCNRAYETLDSYKKHFPRGINDHFICAGNLTDGGVDACQQDSGGPLVVSSTRDGRTFWEVVGVVAFGVDCGSKEYPGVYSRVSTFLPWIVRTAIQLTPPNEVTSWRNTFVMEIRDPVWEVQGHGKSGNRFMYATSTTEFLVSLYEKGNDLLARMARARTWLIPVLLLLELSLAVSGSSAQSIGRVRAKRESCRARHPQRDEETDGRCIPLLECLDSLRSLGRFKVPNFCGVRFFNPIVCCPKMDEPMTAAPPPSTTTTTTTTTTPSTTTTTTTTSPIRQLPPNGTDIACKDQNGVDGKCVPLDRCAALKKAAENKQFPPLCDFKMGVAYVCCITEETPPLQLQPIAVGGTGNPQPPPVTTDELLNDNERYCGKKHYLPPGVTDFHTVVFGGKDAEEGKYKFAVAIFRDKVSLLNFWCGGTLITQRIVLSAAHCFHDTLNDTKYVARIGGVDIKHNGEGPFLERGISDIRIHPDYDPTLYYADVAVLQLDFVTAIARRKVPAACLPDMDSEPEVPYAFVLGWGHDTFGGRVQTHLQEAEVPLVGREQCNSAYQFLNGYKATFPRGINEHFVCAGNLTDGGVDACQQDSGGPLVINTTANNRTYWEIVGIVSFGVGCGSKNYPGVYSRVSTFVPWIVRTAIELTPPGQVTRT